MAYQILILPSAGRELAALPRQAQRRIQAKIDSLAEDPHPAGAAALQGRRGYLRLRVGDYRVIYRVAKEALEVLVIRVGHRRDTYRRMR
jgi:mRNA interferase RelE/StbE